MAETDIPSCDAKGKSIHVAEENGGGQTDQGNASAKSEIRSCDSKGKENTNSDKNVARQTDQGSPSAESWLIQVKAAFEDRHKMRQVSKNVSIYRVPKIMMLNKREAYEPTLVSLGPYHHQMNPKLSAMDEHKLEAVHKTLGRLHARNKTMKDIISEIKMSESKIRECYEEPIELNGETLYWMLAMDACFILEFLRGYMPIKIDIQKESPTEGCTTKSLVMGCFIKIYEYSCGRVTMPRLPLRPSSYSGPAEMPMACAAGYIPAEINAEDYNDGKCNEPSDTDWFDLLFKTDGRVNYLFPAILDDILKLENQIPLFILINILQLECGTRMQAVSNLAAMVTHPKWDVFKGSNSSVSGHIENVKCRHLLDLYRRVIKDELIHSSSESAEKMDSSHTQSQVDSRSTPTAELLEKAGIKFQSDKLQFQKRTFQSSTLYLPHITVDRSTEPRMRNLLAYEECQRCSWEPETAVISHYIYIMNDLIDSQKDVSILRKAKVITSAVGSEEYIAEMFNDLCDGITFKSVKEFEKVMKEAREHYNNQWKVWLSQFKEEHISKPWYVVSLVVGLAILAMTIVQTVYSVKN